MTARPRTVPRSHRRSGKPESALRRRLAPLRGTTSTQLLRASRLTQPW